MLAALVILSLVGLIGDRNHSESATPASANQQEGPVDPALIRSMSDLFQPVAHYMSEHDTVVEGHLVVPAEHALPILRSRFAPFGIVPTIQEEEPGRHFLILTSGKRRKRHHPVHRE